MTTLFYIDPQSYFNLEVYDRSLLSNIRDCHIMYYHSDQLEKADMEGVEYRSRFHYSHKSGLSQVFSYIGTVLGIMCDVVRERPDVVHVQWIKMWFVDYMLLLLLKLMGIRSVFTAHNVLPHNPHRGDRFGYRLYYRSVDAVIVHTHHTAEQLASLFRLSVDKVHVIRHGILPSLEDSQQVNLRADQLREQLHTDHRIVFASMGFQNYYKGADIIVDTWTRTPELRDNPDIMLLMVGEVENADLSQLASCSNVHIFNQKVSNVDFEAYLQLVSVLLLPYREISQSGVLLTALQRGIPVLVSSSGGLLEPLQIAKVGWEMGEASVVNLQHHLLSLIHSPQEISKVRDDKNAFEMVRQAYSWTEIGSQTQQVYQSDNIHS